MRLYVLAILVPGAVAAGLAAHGCGSGEPPLEDYCGWIADPENCYRTFAEDIGDSCQFLSLTENAVPQTGSFLSREALDVCFLEEGGLVTFGTPPSLVAIPEGTPVEPTVFAFVNANGTPCGTGSFVNEFDFSIGVVGDVLPDAGTIPEEAVLGGTFTMTKTQGRETVTVTCPDAVETHFFDRLEITKCSEDYEAIQPRAELVVVPGGLTAAGETPMTPDPEARYGLITFRVYYPPVTGELKGADPVPVDYFRCIIPPAPKSCENQLPDPGETDIDCGGTFCTARCGDGQLCVTANDCQTGFTCDVKMGIKSCTAPGDASSSSASSASSSSSSSSSTATATAGGFAPSDGAGAAPSY